MAASFGSLGFLVVGDDYGIVLEACVSLPLSPGFSRQHMIIPSGMVPMSKTLLIFSWAFLPQYHELSSVDSLCSNEQLFQLLKSVEITKDHFHKGYYGQGHEYVVCNALNIAVWLSEAHSIQAHRVLMVSHVL